MLPGHLQRGTPRDPARARTTRRSGRTSPAEQGGPPCRTSPPKERASWWLVWRSVTEAVEVSPDTSAVHWLEIDEASFRRGLRFHTAFVDLDPGRLLDLVPGAQALGDRLGGGSSPVLASGDCRGGDRSLRRLPPGRRGGVSARQADRGQAPHPSRPVPGSPGGTGRSSRPGSASSSISPAP